MATFGFWNDHTAIDGRDKVTLTVEGGFNERTVLPQLPLTTANELTFGQIQHGLQVAGVVAGNRSDDETFPMHGVAFDAQLRVHVQGPVVLATQAGLYRQLNREVPIVVVTSAPGGSIADTTEAALRNQPGAAWLAAVAQADTAAADRTIYVFSAGNQGRPDPNEGPGLPHLIPELRGHFLAVVASFEDGLVPPANFGGVAGEVLGSSNRCGVASDYCLTAPGFNIRLPFPSRIERDGTTVNMGTSFSASVVGGALAILTQRYRGQLGSDEIVQRMLATADKTGIYADSDIYGQGMLDLDAATRPRGQTRVVTGDQLGGTGVAEALSSLTGGAAFGDALARGLATHEMAAFDELDAPFFRALDSYLHEPGATRAAISDRLFHLGDDPRGLAAPAQPGSRSALRMRFDREPVGYGAADGRGLAALLADPNASAYRLRTFSLSTKAGRSEAFLGLRHHPGWNFGLYADGVVEPGTFSDDSAFANPFLSFARDGEAVGMKWALARGSVHTAAFRGSAQWGARRDFDPSPAHGAIFEYRSPSGAALQTGWLQESGRLMGSRPRGAFGSSLGSRTAFASATTHWPLGSRWAAFAAVHLGFSRPKTASDGLLREVSSLWSSAFGLGISGRGLLRERDQLSLRLSQPLRIESGDLSLRWVSGRTRYRELNIEEATLPLTPSARQLDFELAYALPASRARRGFVSRSWRDGAFNIAALATLNPEHARSNHTEFSLLFRYQRAF